MSLLKRAPIEAPYLEPLFKEYALSLLVDELGVHDIAVSIDGLTLCYPCTHISRIYQPFITIVSILKDYRAYKLGIVYLYIESCRPCYNMMFLPLDDVRCLALISKLCRDRDDVYRDTIDVLERIRYRLGLPKRYRRAVRSSEIMLSILALRIHREIYDKLPYRRICIRTQNRVLIAVPRGGDLDTAFFSR